MDNFVDDLLAIRDAANRISYAADEIETISRGIAGRTSAFPVIPCQRNPQYRNEVFAGGLRFETDGCYVCSFAYKVLEAGYDDDPPEVARKLREAGCFNGAYFSHPERVHLAYPRITFEAAPQWHNAPADINLVYAELRNGPVIAEVDFVWKTQVFNQHFVVLLAEDDTGSDVWIADPWDGSLVKLLMKYADEYWDLKRTLYGLRIFRIEEE